MLFLSLFQQVLPSLGRSLVSERTFRSVGVDIIGAASAVAAAYTGVVVAVPLHFFIARSWVTPSRSEITSIRQPSAFTHKDPTASFTALLETCLLSPGNCSQACPRHVGF